MKWRKLLHNILTIYNTDRGEIPCPLHLRGDGMEIHDKEMFRKNIMENQTAINKLAEQSLRSTLDQMQLITGKGEADYVIWSNGKVFVWVGEEDELDGKFDGIDEAVIHYSEKIRDIYKEVFKTE